MLSRLKYLRIHLFYRLMSPFERVTRRKRMHQFNQAFDLSNGPSVLDLGGQPMIWDAIDSALDITILNLPGIAEASHPSRHRFRYVEGDARDVREFTDNSFDIVFSNSVIEHVGDARSRAEFAREVRRLGRGYWVQTPSKFFPIEAHNGMPFWWWYPLSWRQYFIKRWRAKLPAWTEMIEGTDIVLKRELLQLFPDGKLLVERIFGIPKSYVVYRQPIPAA